MTKTELIDKQAAGIIIIRPKFFQRGTRSGWFISRLSFNGGWDANPWVWVISFERIEKPENF